MFQSEIWKKPNPKIWPADQRTVAECAVNFKNGVYSHGLHKPLGTDPRDCDLAMPHANLLRTDRVLCNSVKTAHPKRETFAGALGSDNGCNVTVERLLILSHFTAMSLGGSAVCQACGNGSSFLPNGGQFAALNDMLRSNVLPPETSSFRATISAAPVELRRYDAETKRLEDELERLISKRRTLASYMDRCRSVFQ
ncbi:hypothetical protein C8J57DRAFT_1234774 [Mycena rebaudengoi]|nr:hypothetical protein C8J57DRAFT_1234774 [Mycena rebaudengoi]